MTNRISIIIVVAIVALCCLCALAAAVGGFAFYSYRQFNLIQITPDILGPFVTDVPFGPTDTPQPPIVLNTEPGTADTLRTLDEEDIPANNLRELAMRLKGIADIPTVVNTTSPDYPVGTELSFFVSNTDSNETFPITARLIYKTDNVYFFAEDGVSVSDSDVKKAVDEFQNKIYATDREYFGSERNPGIDGDPHLVILFARGLGFSTAGYQSSADGFSRLAHEFSNEKEMFYINADSTSPGDPYLLGVLAHEFQHMIQDNEDGNEETWMNEGSSVLAELLNGYDAGGFDYSFVADPDLQLNAWSEDGGSGDSIPHYGAGFLFMDYFLDRFGSEALKQLVADRANGFRAVENTLAARGLSDPVTGRPLTAVDLFADWVIANYLGDSSVSDGRYFYHNYPDAPKVASPTATFDDCPVALTSATVHQFAADYYAINCSGQVTLTFIGSRRVNVAPTDAHSGSYAFWSHRNDKSDTTLTREFDLTGLTTATLNYWAWWAIETDYDYAYLVASPDNGATWAILKTPSCTEENPTGNNFGCGYHDNSGGGAQAEWVEESVDLSAYAGSKILVRFEYITDDAVTRPGFLVDDLSIPELNYAEDFESGEGGWDGAGFVRMDNALPQTFVAQVIRKGAQTTVERFPLDDSNSGTMTITLGNGESAVVVVSGTTLFTTEVASYQFEIK